MVYSTAPALRTQFSLRSRSTSKYGNVRVNAIAPTYINTPMIERLSSEGKIDIGRLERRTPMGRIGTVEDVAHAAAYLLSDLSAYVTGVNLPVDGGWLAYGGPGDVLTA
jgi:NAD(P)-dependent dehydrogenase (short-subunit alcohol dehydrogenase family)